MNAQTWNQITAGFAHESFGSQEVFRVSLDALSHPGRTFDVPINAELPNVGYGASAVVLLGILDSDTRVWLSPHLARGAVAFWLKFHTGCKLVKDPEEADFLWVSYRLGDSLPSLDCLRLGSDQYPDQSATCILEINSFELNTQGLMLSGPGIDGNQQVRMDGLPHDFDVQWESNHSIFPRGVDMLLTTQTQVMGLPRTTKLVRIAEA
jgi:alpha-D-ribose 1-methylphosphonate 5-triphosphate synthase subunit PhnH